MKWKPRYYTHYDGSVCMLDEDVWIVTKVRTPRMGSGPITEELGDPCPYCNRFKDGIARAITFRGVGSRLLALLRR